MKLSLEWEGHVKRYFDQSPLIFREACLAVPPPWGKKDKGIPSTKRQASKWLRGKGIAYKVYRGRV